MKHVCSSIFISLMTVVGTPWVLPADTRPYPDQLGICYSFQDDTQERLEPCVISTGYGAGAHYATLHWADDSTTSITLINVCPEENYDDRGFCAYRVNDQDSEPYERDVFLNPTTIADPDNLTCYRIIETNNSVCYRFSHS